MQTPGEGEGRIGGFEGGEVGGDFEQVEGGVFGGWGFGEVGGSGGVRPARVVQVGGVEDVRFGGEVVGEVKLAAGTFAHPVLDAGGVHPNFDL